MFTCSCLCCVTYDICAATDFFFKQKTAYELRISDWSSDLCSSDLHETIWTFSLLQAAMMGCFGLASANFGAMAMEPMGEVAGTAASLQGFKIGRESCRVRACQYVSSSLVAVSLKK